MAIEAAVDILCDEAIGLLRGLARVEPDEGQPSGLTGYSAEVAEIGRFTSWRPDATGTGVAFGEDAAIGAAVGEAVERYCGNCVSRIDGVGPTTAFASAEEEVVSPTRFRFFVPAQYRRPRFPFVPPADEVAIEWVRGESLTAGRPALLPASIVFLNYFADPGRRSFPRFSPVILPGIAAGGTLEAATLSALLEVVERDTTALWWLAGREATQIEVDDDGALVERVRDGVDAAIELEWFALPSDIAIPTVACLLRDHRRELMGVGFATRCDPREAVLKSTAEAFQIRHVATNLQDPKSAFWRAIQSGRSGPLRLRPHRADRRYVDSFERDGLDMTNLMHNTQFYLDSRAWPEALARFTGAGRVSLDELSQGVVSPTVDGMVGELARVGITTYRADLTTPDVGRSGLRVARVIAPEACINTATAFPALANPRLQRAAGARSGQLGEDAFFLHPLPHS